MFGVSQSALAGVALWEIVRDIEAEKFDGYWAVFDEGDTREAETVHRHDGRAVPVVTVTAQRTIDGPPYHFGTSKDVSERKAREREIARQNERLENFTSIVSHDLRNPLNVAQGSLDIVQGDGERDELRLVDNALGRMDTLITEPLELAWSNDGVGATAPVSLSATAERAWKSVSTADATLQTPDASLELVADGSRLQQPFENLFRNSVEHGPRDVTVTVGETSGGFYVADDGPGIPPEDRERVFEVGVTTNEDGTGFGLSIVKQIVLGHDWERRVTESDAGGARFEVSGVEFVE
ncbi:MAG: sensor histidine kinase [Halobacteriaceae archaeon]